jgi:predicted LPLAT superfamily acyltransferase
VQQSTHNKSNAAANWAAQPERSNAIAIRFIVWVALTLGRNVARLFLYPICIYFMLFAGDARAASKKYLRKVLGREPGIRDSFLHIHTFASTILDRVFLLNGRFDKFNIHVHLDEATQSMISSKQGCILLGAHLGSFEIMRAYAHQAGGPPVSIVMYEDNARKLNAVLNAINPAMAQQVIGLGKVDSMLQVGQALLRGEYIGILADRGLEHSSAVMNFDFLGAPAKFPTGPLRMALLLKQPVLLMAGVYRGGKHYDLYFEQLADMSSLQDLPRNEILRQAMERYVRGIERHCLHAPYNWFNFYDFWK